MQENLQTTCTSCSSSENSHWGITFTAQSSQPPSPINPIYQIFLECIYLSLINVVTLRLKMHLTAFYQIFLYSFFFTLKFIPIMQTSLQSKKLTYYYVQLNFFCLLLFLDSYLQPLKLWHSSLFILIYHSVLFYSSLL